MKVIIGKSITLVTIDVSQSLPCWETKPRSIYPPLIVYVPCFGNMTLTFMKDCHFGVERREHISFLAVFVNHFMGFDLVCHSQVDSRHSIKLGTTVRKGRTPRLCTYL